jgi:hypothetical protein
VQSATFADRAFCEEDSSRNQDRQVDLPPAGELASLRREFGLAVRAVREVPSAAAVSSSAGLPSLSGEPVGDSEAVDHRFVLYHGVRFLC